MDPLTAVGIVIVLIILLKIGMIDIRIRERLGLLPDDGQTLPRATKIGSEWYAYYYPGGPHQARQVGPCKGKEEAVVVLSALTGCSNTNYLAPYTDKPMPKVFKPPLEQTVREFWRSCYKPPIPLNTALMLWSGQYIPTLGPGGA